MGEVVQTCPSRWGVGISLGMTVLGLVASLGILAGRGVGQKPPSRESPPSSERQVDAMPRVFQEDGQEHSGMDAPVFSPVDFQRVLRRMDGASGDSERFDAALVASEHLLRIAPRATGEQRQAMASEYLRALSGKELSSIQNDRLAGFLYEVAARTGNELFFDKAEAAREFAGETASMNSAFLRVDALRKMGRVLCAQSFLDEIREHAETETERARVSLQEVRILDRALGDKRVLRELLGRSGHEEDELLSRRALARMEDRTEELRSSSIREMRTAGLFYSARIARHIGATSDEEGYLREVVMREDGRFRFPAAIRLAEILREESSLGAYAEMLSQWLDWDGGRAALEEEVISFFECERTTGQVHPVFGVIDLYRTDEDEVVCPKVLYLAAREAARAGLLHTASRYLEQIEQTTFDPRVLEQALMLLCEVAERQGDAQALRRAQMKLIALYPGHPYEADIRFAQFMEKVDLPDAVGAMVNAAVGAALRLPRDPRSVGALLTVGRQMEAKTLYDLAASYYRRAALLAALQDSAGISGEMTEALLGKARVRVAQGKLPEAESILRSLHTGIRHIDVWDESGPLWASLAFMQGQPREGVRRWRQVCGAPGGEILPFLFNRFSLEREAWAVRVASPGGGKLACVTIDLSIMERFLRGAMDAFLEEGDMEGAGELLLRVGRDPEWKDRLPWRWYRSRLIGSLAEQEDLDLLLSWMERLAVSTEQAGEMSWGEWFSLARDFSKERPPFHLKGEDP